VRGVARVRRPTEWLLVLAGMIAAAPVAGPGLLEAQTPHAEKKPRDEPGGDTLTISEAVRLAARRNPELQGARARLSGEEAGRWADWGAFLPDVIGRADFDRTNATRITFQGEDGTFQAAPEPFTFTRKSASQQLALEWTLLEGGRRILDVKEGEARVEAAEHRFSLNEREVVARVRRGYLDALEQERLLEVARRQLAARLEELEVTEERVEAGVGTRTDLLGARIEVGRAELAQLEARELQERRRRDLERELGLEDPGVLSERPLEGAPRLPDPDALDVGRLVERAVTGDPGLRALQADQKAASAVATSEWTRYLPEVRARYARSRSESGDASASFFRFDPTDSFGTLGMTISWNIFQGFDRRERTGRARAELNEIRAERRDRALELTKRVESLQVELRSRRDRLEVLERNMELARERLDLARESYREGIRTFDELQVFIDEERAAEEAFLRERFETLRRWVDLEEIVGPLNGNLSSSGASASEG